MEKVKKNKSVKAWVTNHVNNHYVNQSIKDGYRSRAAYKLLELDESDSLFNSHVKIVVDLGSTPGSWSQVARKQTTSGVVIGVDLLPMLPIPGVNFIHGDFTEQVTLDQLLKVLDGQKVDLLLSDMSPNLSGVRGVDQARLSYLIELVLDFARKYLRVGGNCVIKVFNGGEFDKLVRMAREVFAEVIIRKPDASRSQSSETYLLCKNRVA